MSKVDKRLNKWLDNTPVDAPVSEVIGILDRFFDGLYSNPKGGSSHYVVRDERLKAFPDLYGHNGEFTVPVKGGQKVKGVYLKRLSQTIKLIKELENE